MTTSPARRPEAAAPTGRGQVVAAVLDSAEELFASRGPAATSIRDVAARAGVNHGLVHRHFGNKDQLVGAVLDHLGARLAALIDGGAAAEEIEDASERHARVVARVILDGFPAAQMQTAFPGAVRLLQHVAAGDGRSQSRIAVANAIALEFGWQLFGSYLRAATELELSDEEVRNAVRAEIARMLTAAGASEKPGL